MKFLNKSIHSQKEGFSLLELVLVLLILAIIMASVFSTFATGQKTFDAELANAQAQENARYAIDRISEIVQTSGNNPQNITSLNSLNFIRLYSGFNPSTVVGSPPTPITIPITACGGTTGIACPTGNALQLFSDFDGDAKTITDVGTTTANSMIFSGNVITSENVVIYLDSNGLVNLYNFNPAEGLALPGGGPAPAQGAASRAVPIAEFVTNLNFVVDSVQNQVTINVTARSNRAVAIETIYEKRFRYASLVSVVKLRNRN